MKCGCDSSTYFKGNDATLYENKFLEERNVDAINWKTLYQCIFCNSYWEEYNLEDRFVSVPILKKVSELYVKENW